MRRQRFHCERRAEPPFTAHADSEKRAQYQENGEVRRERSQQFHYRIKNDVGHERNAPAESVAEPTEDERTDRPHHQRERDRERDFGDAFAEIVADRNKHERDEEEIERIERPTEETGDKRVALVAIKELKKPNRFHVPLDRRIPYSLLQTCQSPRASTMSD